MSEKLNVHHYFYVDYYQQKPKNNYSPYYYYDSMQYSPYYDYMSMNRQYSYWPQMEMEDVFYNLYPYENNDYDWPYFNYNFPYGKSFEKEKENSTKKESSLDVKKEENKSEKNDKKSGDPAPSSEAASKKDTFLGILKKNIKLSAKKED